MKTIGTMGTYRNVIVDEIDGEIVLSIQDYNGVPTNLVAHLGKHDVRDLINALLGAIGSKDVYDIKQVLQRRIYNGNS